MNDFNTSRILIVKPSAIGDIANSLPFLRGIKAKYPNAKIGWLVNKSYESILNNHPDLDQVFSFDRNMWGKNWSNSFTSLWKLVQQLRAFKPTLTVDLQCLLRTGILTRLSGAPIRIGLEDCREGSRFFYTHLIKYPEKDLHAVSRYWEVAKFLGCTSDIPKACFPEDKSESDTIIQLISQLPRPWIGCCPGARWITKQWPTSYYAKVLTKTQADTSGSIILIGGSDDQKNASEILNHLSPSIPLVNLTGKTSLRGLIAVISKMDFIFSNDTGPLHIAIAQEKTIISPFLCTKVKWNGPFGQFHNAVETSVHCKGSYLKTCPKMICLDELTPEKLYPVVESVIRLWKSNQI